MLRLTDVGKSYDNGATMAVRDVTLHVAKGEVVALIGESGCGKSTTLRMVNRLVEPTSGTIEVNGENVADANPSELRRNIGYVFQDIGLFPHYSVEENVAAVPKLLGWDAKRRRDRAVEVLEFVGLPVAEYGARSPGELSGGQQQRVGVARALAAEPEMMLMDEPFGALDPITRAGVQDEFQRIQQELDLTVLMVTHDMTEAMLLADRIAVMKDGAIEQVGPPRELLSQPATDYVRALVELPKERADRVEALLEGGG